MFGRRRAIGTATSLATNQKQKQHTDCNTKVDEADQREYCVAAANYFAMAVGCAKKSVDQPGCRPNSGAIQPGALAM